MNMAFRFRAVSYKGCGHAFKQLQDVFGVCRRSYYKRKKLKEETVFCSPPVAKRTRKRKIDPAALKAFAEENPGLYLRALAERFDCSDAAVHKRLAQLNIAYKKRRSLIVNQVENGG
jgi:transposase